ncbi:MAG: hypothetical protein QM627_08510 [Luteolibacter sp.]
MPPSTVPDPAKATGRSPLAGCAILVTVGVMVLFLVFFSVFSFFRQANEIAKFTDTNPVPVAITPIDGRETEIQALNARLEAFHQQLDQKEPATLALSADDLNLAIAAYEPFNELRGTFRIEQITPENLHIGLSYRLNGKPRFTKEGEPGVMTSNFRYLNATLIARPWLEKNEISLRIDEVRVPGKTVPPEFAIRMSPLQIMQRYLDHPVMGPVMKKLTRIELADGQVLLKRIPGENQINTITNEEVDTASTRLFTVLGIMVTLFLLVVAVLIYTSYRRQLSKVE